MFRCLRHILHEAKPRLRGLAKSQRGHNAMVFTVFVAIAAALWMVMWLNEEATYDLRLPVRLTQVPDSVTVISDLPDNVQVTVRGKGTQLLRYLVGDPEPIEIDYRVYRSSRGIRLGDVDLKSLMRSQLGGASPQAVSPDSIVVLYTSAPPSLMPVQLDCHVTSAPGVTLVGMPALSLDSVRVYSAGNLSTRVKHISTEPLRIDNVKATTTVRVRLLAPAGTRVMPDSADLTIAAEPLILKEREVVVEGVGAPAGSRLITFPAKVKVKYMVPMSAYTKSEPAFRVLADYADISQHGSGRVRLRLRNVPPLLQNVRLTVDSADYYISQ